MKPENRLFESVPSYCADFSIVKLHFSCRRVDAYALSTFKVTHLLLIGTDFGEVGDRCELAEQLGEQCQTIIAYGFVFGHDHDFMEEAIDGFAQAGDLVECAVVVAAALLGLDAGGGFPAGFEEFAFGVVFEEFRVDA